MKGCSLTRTALFGASFSVIALSSGHAALVAGVDFDVTGSLNGDDPQLYTEPDFLSVPVDGSKDYNVTQNGITFDIDGDSTGGNANRFRSGTNGGTFLTRDFIQWFSSGGIPQATVTLTGLLPDTEYTVSFFNYNAGSFQQEHIYYEGAVDPVNLLGSFTASGNPATNPGAWVPGVDWTLTSDGTGEIVVTVVASTERLTLNGIAVDGIPEPSSALLAGLGALALLRRRR